MTGPEGDVEHVGLCNGAHWGARLHSQRVVTGVLVVFIVMLAAKCGGSRKPTDARQRVADTVKRFESAAIRHDATTYCALLTESERTYVLQHVRQSVGLGGPCPTVMRPTLHLFVSKLIRVNLRVTSSDVTFRDGHADVVPPGDKKHVELHGMDGTWKVSGLPGTDFAC